MKNNLYGRNFIKKEWSGDFRWIYKERAELAPNHSLKKEAEAWIMGLYRFSILKDHSTLLVTSNYQTRAAWDSFLISLFLI